LDDLSGPEIGAAHKVASQRAQRVYQEAIAQVFTNCCSAMASGGLLIVVAADKWRYNGNCVN
jgi:hypothetical protein